MTEPEATPLDILRGYVLASGRDDWVSMAAVVGRVSRDRLANSASEGQQLVVATVRSLLLDGLIEVGDIPGEGDPGFMPWTGTVEQVMSQFTDRFVEHHDDRLGWEYTIWLNLTAEGEGASADVIRETPGS